MKFISFENLSTCIELVDVKENSNIVYYHFMEYEDEILYVMDGEALYGVLSISDVQKSWNAGSELLINKNFHYVESKDDIVKAKELFSKMPYVHEIPVITKGEFRGILHSEKRKSIEEWKSIRASFMQRHYKDFGVTKDEIKECMRLGCICFVYPFLSMLNPEKYISNEELMLFQEKQARLKGKFDISLMTEEEQRSFCYGSQMWNFRGDMNRYYRERKLETMNGVLSYKDSINNPIYNYRDGKRITASTPATVNCTIKLVGPCTFAGMFVTDEETIASYIQNMVNKKFLNCRVEDLSIGNDYSLKRLLLENVASNDIIVIMTSSYDVWKEMSREYPGQIICTERFDDFWKEIDNPVGYVYDSWNHCNWKVNKVVAELIYKDIEGYIKEDGPITYKKLRNYYVPEQLHMYYQMHFLKHVKEKKNGIKGAIVMNCNPFTKGHRYLIECAASLVDYLYVFVVQENESFFSFEDRFEMVKQGVQDIDKVYVIPSGRFIISQETFGEYFNKEQLEEINNPEYDVAIFGEIVSKEFDIKIRFVGEEPFDKVTNTYNETLKQMMPEYGVEIVEIPRVSNEEDEIISASRVRNYIKEKNIKKLELMLPKSTMEYLNKIGIL